MYDLIRQLLNAEEVLHEHDCLKSEWGQSWQKEWRISALACQTIEDTALHLVTLQVQYILDAISSSQNISMDVQMAEP